MMKKYFVLIISIFLCSIVNAQWSFTQGFNISFSDTKPQYYGFDNGGPTPIMVSAKIQAIGYNGFWLPQYHLIKKTTASKNSKRKPQAEPDHAFDFSIGIPVSVGINGFGNSQNGAAISYFLSAGGTANINFGNFKFNNEQSLGAFAGIGLGLISTNNTFIVPTNNYKYTTEPTLTYSSKYRTIDINKTPNAFGIGPLLNAGFQFKSPFGRGGRTGIYASYLLAINNYGKNFFGISLLYSGNLGGNNMYY
jgi:hypothetical protein